jgi:hypothetical protein
LVPSLDQGLLMSILGEFERLLADLYPYRVPLSIAAFAIAAVLLALVL